MNRRVARRRFQRIAVSLAIAPLACLIPACFPGAAGDGRVVAQATDGQNRVDKDAAGPLPGGSSPNSAAVQTRVSLKVRDAPLAQVLALLENTAPVRFRYGALPDAVVSADLRDVALLPALEYLLRGVRWQTRYADAEIFLLRRQTPEEVAADAGVRPSPNVPTSMSPQTPVAPLPAVSSIAGWQYWSGVQPPPRRWMTPEESGRQRPLRDAGTAEGNPGGAGSGNAVRENSNELETPRARASWRDTAFAIEPQRRPGISVFVPSGLVPSDPARAEGSNSSRTQSARAPMEQVSVWMRWRMRLSFVPRDARLLLETPVAATLYVNGAPVLPRWSGMRMVDLSYLLRRGDNMLALHWPLAPRDLLGPTGSPGSSDALPSAPALLRYEWLCDASGAVVTGDGQ